MSGAMSGFKFGIGNLILIYNCLFKIGCDKAKLEVLRSLNITHSESKIGKLKSVYLRFGSFNC